MGEWGIVPFVLKLYTGWSLVASLSPYPFYFHGKAYITHWIAGCWGGGDPRAGLEATLEKGKIFCCCTQPSTDPPSSQGIVGGRVETTGKIRQIKVAEDRLFYCSWTTWCSPEHIHLHPACCPDIHERVAWITFLCLSLITHCPDSKSGQYCLTAGLKLIG
jgi:hypothetical protein